MTRKKTGGGLGNSLANDRRKKVEQQNGYTAAGVAEHQIQRSVLEQSSLDDFIAKAEQLDRSQLSTEIEAGQAELPINAWCRGGVYYGALAESLSESLSSSRLAGDHLQVEH